MFLTVYGINNIGKSTQCRMLVEALNEQGIKAIHLKYPNYEVEESGPFLKKALRSNTQNITEAELQLWMTLNRHQYEKNLLQHIQDYDVVIAEDYTETAIAWGSVKGLKITWIEIINEYLIKEDHSILIDGERSSKSIEAGHIHENQDDLIQKVRAHYLQRATEKNWHIIQRQQEIRDTHALLVDKVLTLHNG